MLKLLTLLLFLSANLSDPEFQWVEDWSKAQEVSSEQQKPILLVFTGSDWCRNCMKLEASVLESSTFQGYLSEAVIPFRVDFPRSKKNQPEESIVLMRAEIAEKYNPEGSFPKMVLIDAEGEILFQSSYLGEDPQLYIPPLQEAIQNP